MCDFLVIHSTSGACSATCLYASLQVVQGVETVGKRDDTATRGIITCHARAHGLMTALEHQRTPLDKKMSTPQEVAIMESIYQPRTRNQDCFPKIQRSVLVPPLGSFNVSEFVGGPACLTLKGTLRGVLMFLTRSVRHWKYCWATLKRRHQTSW